MESNSNDHSYTDMTRETLRYKDNFFELDRIKHDKSKKRFSQIYLLKLAFEGVEDPKLALLQPTLFQKQSFIQGPASAEQFSCIGLPEVRKALEDFIISNSDVTTGFWMQVAILVWKDIDCILVVSKDFTLV